MIRYLLGKYNRNRRTIWIVAGIVIAIYAIVHIINNSLEQQKLEIGTQKNVTSNNEEFYKTNYSVISSQEINPEINNENMDIIKSFINYCNNSEIKKAYDMISDSCKNVLFPSLETFEKEYYNQYFNGQKTFNIQLWLTEDLKKTYRVEIMDDLLANGGMQNFKKIDYYTTIKNGEEYKLNIAGFLEKNDINFSEESEDLIINVKSEEVFVDYINLNLEIQNKTNKRILLDSGVKGNSVYMIDTQNISYVSYLYEEPEDNLIIENGLTKELSLKFQKEYKKNIRVKEIGFLDITLNYGVSDTNKKDKVIIELEKE